MSLLNVIRLVCCAGAVSLACGYSDRSAVAGGTAPLGPVPRNCPPVPTPHPLFKSFQGVGGGYTWVNAATLRPINHLAQAQRTAHGWGFRVQWLIDPASTDVVTVRAWNLRSGAPVWLALGDGAGANRLVLDPAAAPDAYQSSYYQRWRVFPTVLTVPSAGCYALYAQWSSGAWLVPFATGR